MLFMILALRYFYLIVFAMYIRELGPKGFPQHQPVGEGKPAKHFFCPLPLLATTSPVCKLEVKLIDDCPHVVGAPLSHGRHKHWDNPEDNGDTSDDGQKHEPEPENNINLFVDDIHPKHTERVKLLKGARTTIEAKVTFCHPWEYSDERVSAEFLVLTAPACSGQTKIREGAAQENIRDLDLNNYVDKVEELAKVELSSPHLMVPWIVQSVFHVLRQLFHLFWWLVSFARLACYSLIESLDNVLQ